MTQEKVSPLRERIMEDMRIRGMQETSQKAHIRALKDFATFLGRSPDIAEPDDLRAYQLHMADTNVTPSTFNARIVALRFFFSMTCDRDEMKKYMQFRTEPRKLPIVLSVEEVSALLAEAPGPGLKYRAALSIGYGGGLRASEVTHLKVRDIDSDRMLIHVERGKGGKDRDVMPPLMVCMQTTAGQQVTIFACFTAGLLARGAPARVVISGPEPRRPDIATSIEPGVHVGQTPLSWFARKPLPVSDGWDQKTCDVAHIAS